MTHLLDTDTCIDILRGNDLVMQRFLSRKRTHVGISVVSEGELRTGAAKSASAAKTLRAVESFLDPLQVVPFLRTDTAAYATIRSDLESRGEGIGPLDTLIAAQAVSRALTLVSSNGREFGRIRGLALEDWRA